MTTREFVDFMFDEWMRYGWNNTFVYMESAKQIDEFRYHVCEDLSKLTKMSEAERLDATRMWFELAVSLIGGDYWGLALDINPPSYKEFDEYVKKVAHNVECWHIQ